MNILLVTSFPIPHVGGVSTHFELLRQRLGSAGILAGWLAGADVRLSAREHVKVYCSALRGRDRARAAYLSAQVSSLARRIVDALLANSRVTIHCHDVIAANAAVLAAATLNRQAPIVLTIHGPLSREILAAGISRDSTYVAIARQMEERAYSSVAQFIAVDEGQAEILEHDFCVSREKITIIRNAVDGSSIRNTAEIIREPTMTDNYILVPRRLVPKNGVDTAIRAFAALGETNLSCVVAGDGPLRPQLVALTHELNIADRVKFLGGIPHDRLLGLVARSCAVVVPSVPCCGVVEATSIAALEALACGVPVAGSDIGGLKEILGQTKAGFTFPPGDHNALRMVLERILALSPAERAEAFADGIRLVDAEFGVDYWMKQLLSVYRSLWDRESRC